MRYPNFNQEKKLKKEGYKMIMGLDESGRGPLAGPVVTAGVVVKDFSIPFLKEINDSKKLSFKKRKELFKKIEKCPNIKWDIAKVFPKIIDRINILESTKLAMQRVSKKMKVDYLIIDGNFKLNIETPQKSIIKGDEKIISCSLASIIAKVKRDETMIRYHKKYSKYGFDVHKGYPTKLHKRMIKRYGICLIHRKTFSF